MTTLYVLKMENSKDVDLAVTRYCNEIGSTPFYETFFKNLQRITALNGVNSNDFKNTLVSALRDFGLENDLKNDIYHWIKERNFHENGVSCWVEKEPMDYLRKAQMQWEKRIYKSLNSMCTELNVSLSVFRPASHRDEIMEKWTMLSTYNMEDLAQYRPVYAPKDFLEVLLNIQNPNQEISSYGIGWDFSRISFKVKSFVELKSTYSDLIENKPLLGTCLSTSQIFQQLETERIFMGNAVLLFFACIMIFISPKCFGFVCVAILMVLIFETTMFTKAAPIENDSSLKLTSMEAEDYPETYTLVAREPAETTKEKAIKKAKELGKKIKNIPQKAKKFYDEQLKKLKKS